MSRRTTAALTAAGLVLAGSAVPGSAYAGSSTAANPPGTVVLPPVYGDSVPRTDLLGSGAASLGYSVSRGSSQRPSFRYWTPTRGAVDSGVVADTVSIAGNQAAIISARSGRGPVSLVDLTSGDVRVVPQGPTQGDTFAATGDGFLIHISSPNGAPAYDQLQLMSGAAPWSVNFPVPGYVSVSDVRADAHGALVQWAEFDDGDGVTLSYVDFATKRWTRITRVREIGTIAMTATQIAWVRNGNQIFHRSRSALTTSTATYTAPTPVSILAMTASAIAWETGMVGGPDGDRITHVWTRVGTHAAVKVGTIAGEPMPLGNDFAVVSGSTSTTAGVYRLHPGATALAGRLVSSGPDAPLSVAQSAGRFLYQAPTAHTAVVQRVVRASLSSTSPTITVAKSTTLTRSSVIGVPPAASGGHTATYECAAGSCAVVVREATSVIARIRVVDSVTGVGLSGNHLLVSSARDRGDSSIFYSDVYDLNSLGSAPLRQPYSTGVSGSRIAFVSLDGSVTVRDLSGPTPVDTVVRPAGMPVGNTAVRPIMATVLLAGDWVLWTIPDDTLDGAETRAVHLTDGSVTSLPVPDEVLLADGVASYISAADRSVHLVNLLTSVDTRVGTAQPQTSNRRWLGMSNEIVAFVAADDTTHLVPLVGAQTVRAAARVEGVVRTTASSLVRPLRVQLDASRPLTSWRFIVTNSRGAAVFASHGTAPDGGARPSWSGRSTSGARVPDGTYTWHLTGAGIGGALVNGAGSASATTGPVRLDTVAPRLHLHVPSTTGRTSLLVRWSTSEHATVTVTVAKRVRRHGHWTWTKPRTWVRTAATAAVYSGRTVPFRLVAGEKLRFRVVASDGAGNLSSVATARIRVR